MAEAKMSCLALKFERNLFLMTVAVMPAVMLCLMQYQIRDWFGERLHLLAASWASVFAFRAGIAPAFFPRVEHPLHWLDRCRWVSGCICIALLVLASSCSDGAVYAYNLIRPFGNLRVSEYSEFAAQHYGAVRLNDVYMDTS
ncbi:unnamed protein product, partial [Effrenium voratum]